MLKEICTCKKKAEGDRRRSWQINQARKSTSIETTNKRARNPVWYQTPFPMSQETETQMQVGPTKVYSDSVQGQWCLVRRLDQEPSWAIISIILCPSVLPYYRRVWVRAGSWQSKKRKKTDAKKWEKQAIKCTCIFARLKETEREKRKQRVRVREGRRQLIAQSYSLHTTTTANQPCMPKS